MRNNNRVRTPTVLQMEATECGAAALGMILGYHGRFEPLEKLRVECGVSRDGSKASNIVKAARKYGLIAKGHKREPEELKKQKMPVIVFWNFDHFLVVEGFKRDRVYLNDPATGPRDISEAEFDESFTGVVLTFESGPNFKKGGARPNILKSLRKRLSGSRLALTYCVLVGLVLVVPGLVIPTFSRIFIDDILVGGRQDWIRPLITGMALTAVIRAFLTWLRGHYLLRLSTKIAISTSGLFLSHVLKLPMEFYAQRYAGDISIRVEENDRVSEMLSGQLATTLLDMLTIVFFMVLMFQYDVLLTFVAITAIAINLIALKLISRKRTDLSRRLLQEHGKLMGTAVGGLQTIETIKSSGSESDFFARWSGQYTKVSNAEQKLGVLSRGFTILPMLLNNITIATILILGAFRVMDGILSIGMLVAFQSLLSSFLEPVSRFVNFGSMLQDLQGNMTRLDDVFLNQVDSQYTRDQEREDSQEAFKKLSGNVEMVNINFGYSRLDPPLIQNFNLVLRPGARIALVGPTGCGKTTIARILSGLYKPWSGEILLDRKLRAAYPQRVLNNSIAFVDQDIFLFEGTVRENLSLWDTTTPEPNILLAGKDACIHEDIITRSEGYDCFVEENGTNFSGGQRQRLEIARALVGNPSVLVLDEATSALDADTEKTIDRNLRRRGCSCIIVAHRLSTIRDCDVIIVMDKGKVVQHGTHEDLKSIEGMYADLIKTM